jgi:hypothetical protein
MDSTTVSNETAALINTLTGYLKDGAAFVKAQAPDVIQQLLAWELSLAWFWAIITAILMILAPSFAIHNYRRIHGEYDDGHIVASIAGWVVMVISSIGFICNVMTIIQINVAPKIFLLEYLKGMLK